ncbi:MAG: hypothetical protein KDA28_15800, partial [Phycisphaerales bacterium]|nr:hypothetical protein [Phycisphaerales bacterium]
AHDDHVNGPWSETQTFIFNAMNAPPGRPDIISPVGVAANNPPVLRFRNATDPEGERVSYQVELYTGSSPNPDNLIFLRNDWPENPDGITSVEVDVRLEDGANYLWRVRAVDATQPGAYAIALFTLDADNTPPGPPTPILPLETDVVLAGDSVTLQWENAEDPDEFDRLTYVVDLATDEEFEMLVDSLVNIPEGNGDTTTTIVEATIEPEVTYWWRVAASDGAGMSDFASASFTPIASNTPPTPPEPIAPLRGNRVQPNADGGVELIADNSSDPDGQRLTYEFQVSRDVGFTQITFRVDDVTEGDEVTAVFATNLLTGEYFWRVRAFDGLANSNWSGIHGFIVEPRTVEEDVGTDVGDTGADVREDVDPGTDGGNGSNTLGGGGCATAPGSARIGWVLAMVGVVALWRRRQLSP